MTKVKAKDRFYYYLYVYDCSQYRGTRPVYSLGSSDKALLKLTEWEEGKAIPVDLVRIGIKKEQVNKWRRNVENDNVSKKVACCSYELYNKNRKRPQRQLESFSH